MAANDNGTLDSLLGNLHWINDWVLRLGNLHWIDKTMDLKDYTDEELVKAWDRLEKLKLTSYVQKKMDDIEVEINRRGILAWNKEGKITNRWN